MKLTRSPLINPSTNHHTKSISVKRTTARFAAHRGTWLHQADVACSLKVDAPTESVSLGCITAAAAVSALPLSRVPYLRQMNV